MKHLEKELIPLVFVQMNFDGSSVYQRLDTGKKVNGECVDIIAPGLEVSNIPYDGIGKIKMGCPIEYANGLILKIPKDLSEKDLKKDRLYSGEHCYIQEKAFQIQEEYSELGKGFSIE